MFVIAPPTFSMLLLRCECPAYVFNFLMLFFRCKSSCGTLLFYWLRYSHSPVKNFCWGMKLLLFCGNSSWKQQNGIARKLEITKINICRILDFPIGWFSINDKPTLSLLRLCCQCSACVVDAPHTFLMPAYVFSALILRLYPAIFYI